jgi:hypothetical protein
MDTQTLITVTAAASVTVVVACAYLVSTRYMGLRREELETAKAVHHLELVRFMTDEKFSRAITDILWRWQWTDYDDYWSKYSPRSDPDANVTRRLARDYYVGLASLVRSGAASIEQVYELNPSGVTRYWEKMGPIAREFRRRNEYPEYLEPVEYLAKEIEKLRERRGVSAPKQLQD